MMAADSNDTLTEADRSNPYAVISERNVFHLNPIPPPPEPEAPKVELPDIKLSGFLKIGNTTHALFCYTPKDKKDGPLYYDLVDGEKQGILECVKIDESKGEVAIVNSGTPATLTLKDNSLEPQTAVASNGKPGEGHHPFGGPGEEHHQFGGPGPGPQRNNPFAYPIPQRRTRM